MKSGKIVLPISEVGDSRQMSAYLAVPRGATPSGSILLIQEIFGVTDAMRAIADDFASSGYVVLVPDIYWRLAPGLELGNGEDPVERDHAVAYSKQYDEALGTDDLVVAVNWLHDTVACAARPAVVGFCLGGRMAVRVAAKTALSCMVSMYGVGLDRLDSEIVSIGSPVQFHFGDNDNHNPMPVIEAVRRIVQQRQNKGDEFFLYAGVEHAFYNKYRLDRFNPSAHDLARQRLLAFIRRYEESVVQFAVRFGCPPFL
jgi:carboxymethylenebutenolidase